MKQPGGKRDGGGKNKHTNRLKKSNSSMNPDNESRKGANLLHKRDRATINRLKMYKSGGKNIRNADGQMIKPMVYQSWLPSGTMARVQPDRRWFGNTRVIGQKQLEQFRDAMADQVNDPYQVLMRRSKLPLSLLEDNVTQQRVHLLETETFENTFGKKSQRKRPRVATTDLNEMLSNIEQTSANYDVTKDSNFTKEVHMKDEKSDRVFHKGQSKRIWGELYKVIDSADVLIQVLDARDPMGTRTPHIEQFLKKEKPHKHLIFVLNKCDLVPTWVTAKWVKTLSAEHPTLAFHASINNPFGKGSLIQLLRQFGKFHEDKKQISVGFIGYPNVGKSSVINTLSKKKVCTVAPVPGQTKVWQYITLFRRIYLIDCPGVVYSSGDSETETVLKGVVRLENIRNPEDHIGAVLHRAKKEYIEKTYGVSEWKDHVDFLEQMAHKYGKLLKGGEADIGTVAKMVLHDWQRGRIPYFSPPTAEQIEKAEKINEERKKRRGKDADTLCVPQRLQNIKKTTDVNDLERETAPIEAMDELAEIAQGATDEVDNLEMKDLEAQMNEEDGDALGKRKKRVAKSATKTKVAKEESKEEKTVEDNKEAEEGEPDWDTVFNSVVGEVVPNIPGEENKVESEEEEEEERERGDSADEGPIEEDVIRDKRGNVVPARIPKPYKKRKMGFVELEEEEESTVLKGKGSRRNPAK
eukprot:Ihof_evm1s250 gene=Ihof_evmTU1s250